MNAAGWLALVVTLPTQGATARMRIWRAMKANGCAALRDGVYLLPSGGERRAVLTQVADECRQEGGSAWLMAVNAASDEEAAAYCQLFDRRDELAQLRTTWREAHGSLAALSTAELTRLQRRLQREYDALRAIDFFPGEASVEAEAAWGELARRIQAQLSPDEPHSAAGRVPRLDAAAYQGRQWATRRRLWVDRVASAWLIQRFIDPQARFLWLSAPSDCPPAALGFDFDGATFSHVDQFVTFETLMLSFGLEDDAALGRVAAMVHQLDVGGDPVPEATGFEAVLSGARERIGDDDDALLAEIGTLLDSLYAHFKRDPAKNKT
ncbi:MAG TPA: chromate resistance protein ChrB domain-containing protein [Ideonella sp.]|uniref:chromate resistance protein ChrB domain-containing protein n=1 Tax=Ideonella sp. TaxID=1929293 RepID=UPI002CF856F2|nr:chromate resistance protein ChrB domain-containing protein [Ideonella sp.]HSI48503.1 chromate resistance protein ChrB domain-containing protein [Ideonella sp.]